VEERPSASLIRPYVLTPDGTPHPPNHDSPTAILPNVSARRPAPSAAAHEPDAVSTSVPAGGSEPTSEPPAPRNRRSEAAGSPPALRPAHRNLLAAMAAVIALAIVLVARVTATGSGAEPADGSDAHWFTPGAAGPIGATSGVSAQAADDTPDYPPGASGPSYPPGGGKAPAGDGQPAATGPAKAVPSGGGGNTPAQPNDPPQNATAYTVIQAETFDEQNGVKIENAPTGSGRHVGFITTGDWIRYDNLGFTDVPATKLQISAANWAKDDGTGVVEVRLDDRAALPIGTMTIPNNHSWFDFVTYTMTIQPTTGVHTVYLTFTSTQREEFGNIDWLQFRH
jgi:hypothetical protein